MGYFSKDLTREKLIVLYFFDVTDFELTKDSAIGVLLDISTESYFVLAAALEDLAEVGMLAVVNRPSGQCFCIAEHGRYAIDQFKDRLPQSVRKTIDDYALTNRQRILRASQYNARYEKKDDKQYVAHMSIYEGGLELMKLEVNVSSPQLAATLCNRFADNAHKAYKAVFDALISD